MIENDIIKAMIRDGMIKAFGGSGTDVQTILTTLRNCDEAVVTLRKSGKPVGVLIIANDDDIAAVQRGAEAIRTIGEEDGS